MTFDRNNPVVKLCLQGIGLERQGKTEEARPIFLQAWNDSTEDFERFLAAHHVSRLEPDATTRLKWLRTMLELALKIGGPAVASALPVLHTKIAECHAELGDHDAAGKHRESAAACPDRPTDEGPFYHGTKADLKIGDLLKAGGASNYQTDLTMNHVYFTALKDGAGLAAALAKGDGPERVYLVEPTGPFEDDPNVTNKHFPGNPTRSYRSVEPLTIVAEVSDWARVPAEERQAWRDRLGKAKGDIIN